MNDAQIQNGLRQLDLLDPLPVQLMNFYKSRVLHGDLGVSNIYRMGYCLLRRSLRKGACFHDDGRYGALYLAVAGPACHRGPYGAQEGKVVR